jgi:ClpP class serine protease
VNPDDVERLSVLQQDIHCAFKDHVRRRRAGKIDLADESLFSGDVLTGHMAAERGLIDGVGELRATMRARYGENVRLRAIAAERRRPLWGRLPFVGREPADVIADLGDWVEARVLWGRFGL